MSQASKILEGSMKATMSKLEKDGYFLYAKGVTADGRKAVIMAKGDLVKKFKMVTPSGLAQPTMDFSSLPKEYNFKEIS